MTKEVNLVRFIRLKNLVNTGMYNAQIDYNPNCSYLNLSMGSLDHYRYNIEYDSRHDPNDGRIHSDINGQSFGLSTLEYFLISCWSIEENLNINMLSDKFIGKNDAGILLFSTNINVKKLFEKIFHNVELREGKVIYYDEKTISETIIQPNQDIEPVLHKKISFRDEQEYRFWMKQPKNWNVNQISFSVNPSFLTGYRIINPNTTMHIKHYFFDIPIR